MAQRQPTAAAMASYRRLRLPFARPQTLQKSAVWILSFLNPCHAQCCRQKPPQGHSNGSKAPRGRSNDFFYKRSRLPFATPQTLQTFQFPQKFAQLRREKVPQQGQHAPRPQAKATTRPQEWLKGTPRPQQWLLIRVQGCRLPSLKRSKPCKSSPSSAGTRYPNKPNTRHSRTQKPPHGHSNGSRTPHGRRNGFFYRRSRLPFARPQTLQTFQLLQKSAQLRRQKVPQQAQHARRSQARATTRPQQWLKGHPKAATMASYRRLRLPFARPQTLQTLQKSAQLRREKVPQQAQRAPLPHAKATTRPQQWLKGAPPGRSNGYKGLL